MSTCEHYVFLICIAFDSKYSTAWFETGLTLVSETELKPIWLKIILQFRKQIVQGFAQPL